MSIVLENLQKSYGPNVVVSQLSLEIAEGEFFVLVGASGSGKSTVLRMIAGLTPVDEGRILFGSREVTNLRPQVRNVGMVFQNYALFRHMTVAENVEFSLTVRRRPASERRRRREELLELVGLAGMGGRLPSQLSGGQQQRVALARALAHEPSVLLLDEPFGALDAPIRAELRRSLMDAHRALGVTTILVTHDQHEAFELGDRIGVMRVGRLLEVGPPKDLYAKPTTEYAARFLGVSNLFVGDADEDGLRLGGERFPIDGAPTNPPVARRVQVLFRPEDVVLGTDPTALQCPALAQGSVEEITFAGSTERLRLRLPRLAGIRPIAPAVPFGDDCIFVEALRAQDEAFRNPVAVGASVWVGVRRIHALPNPGLSVLVLAEETPSALAALAMAGELARRAHARLAVVRGQRGAELDACVQRLKDDRGPASVEVRDSAGPLLQSFLEEPAYHYFDLAVQAMPRREILPLISQQLQAGDHHLLLVPPGATAPKKALICVAVGEPGKEDVRFAGRIARHFGSEATILCVLDPQAPRDLEAHARRFLERGQRTLGLAEVTAHTLVRRGTPADEIMKEARDGGHDLLVMGSPWPRRYGGRTLRGCVGQILERAHDRSVMIVRSQSGESRLGRSG
jgi:sulfate transport system ATP-binding protein